MKDPAYFTTDGGTISAFDETYSYTTNAYRAGVDFRVLPRTTISFDEFLSYFKQDNVVTDNPAVNPRNFGYVLANRPGQGTPTGTPVDLGNIWSTQTPAEALPCATPIVAGTTNTATPTCNGFLSYSQVGNPRNFMPTERLRFQSNYFKNFEMSGSVGYSTSNNMIPDFLETVNGLDRAHRHARKHDGRPGECQARLGECGLVGRVFRHRQVPDPRYLPVRQLAHSGHVGARRNEYLWHRLSGA